MCNFSGSIRVVFFAVFIHIVFLVTLGRILIFP